jgi:hypothetical protein
MSSWGVVGGEDIRNHPLWEPTWAITYNPIHEHLGLAASWYCLHLAASSKLSENTDSKHLNATESREAFDISDECWNISQL